MQHLRQLLPSINGLLKTYRLPGFILVLMLSFSSIKAQTIDPVQSIRDLKEGILIVRFPAYKAKIDTLQAMIGRTTDKSSIPRLQKLLAEAIGERDSLSADYTKAFRKTYKFSAVGYYFDNEGRDLRSAHFYTMDGKPMASESISLKPVFYLYFMRTQESHIDALIITNMEGQEIPAPFPNNFTRGGINFLFMKLSEKKFPEWRVSKINKQLVKYWSVNREM